METQKCMGLLAGETGEVRSNNKRLLKMHCNARCQVTHTEPVTGDRITQGACYCQPPPGEEVA